MGDWLKDWVPLIALVLGAGGVGAFVGTLVTTKTQRDMAAQQREWEQEQRDEDEHRRLLAERKAAGATFLAALHSVKVEQTDQTMTPESRRQLMDAFGEVTLLFPQPIGDLAESAVRLDPHAVTDVDAPHPYDEAVNALVAAVKTDLGID
jgi:hypothetical protein